MLTEEQKNKYLMSPYLCPYCGSDELSLGKLTADIRRAGQIITCGKCKKRGTKSGEVAVPRQLEIPTG